MTIAEKIQYAADKKVVTFFKEGLFYKCYNEDVMVFVKNVKEYKVSGKFVKSVGADVYSIGFPVSEVEKGKMTLEFITKKLKQKVLIQKMKILFFCLKIVI
jgi:short-subunit dehydrogenase